MSSSAIMQNEVRVARRVLVVEDDPRLREVLCDALPEMEFEAHGVASAREARRKVQEQRFGIVLLDLNLPDATGLELLAEWRAQPAMRNVAAVLLTAFGDLPVAQRAIELDVAAFLTKPCRLNELEAALGRALAHGLTDPVPPEVPCDLTDATEPMPKKGDRPLAEIERDHILATLARHHGNRTHTAAALKISLRTLHYRLREYERPSPTPSASERT